MAKQDQEGPGGLPPGVMVLIAAVFGVLLYRGPALEPTRTMIHEPRSQIRMGSQNVEARLWEDPFEASARATEKQRVALSKIDFNGMGEGRKRLDILSVILNGMRYVGTSETRRRARYAVISALHSSGYGPKDSVRIGVAVASPKPAGIRSGCDPSGDLPLPVPFEVFQKPGDDGESVCVLWIDEAGLGECPLKRLRSLLGTNPCLETCLGDGPQNGDSRIRMKFIGPESLSTLENSLARNNEKIKAVVLFGTDVYDKILIMKALRPYFPGAFFCTSDLDALFLSSQNLKWTRNLVVVSGFGFTLQKELQGHILPFRSSRQTAQYFATLAALNASIDELQSIDEKKPSDYDHWFTPRVFEIGRTRAIDLSPDCEGQKRKLSFTVGSKKFELENLHPERPVWHRNSASQFAGIFLLLLLLAGLS